MYIGTDLVEKSGTFSVIDKIDFSFGISKYSVPYQDIYGIDYSDAYNKDVLKMLLVSGINNLQIDGLSLNGITLDSRNKKIGMVLDYNGQSINKELE